MLESFSCLLFTLVKDKIQSLLLFLIFSFSVHMQKSLFPTQVLKQAEDFG